MKITTAIVTALIVSLSPLTAFAGGEQTASSATTMLLAVTMIAVMGVCFFVAIRVFSYLKGGELASAWQILSISFAILVIAEAVKLLAMLNIVNIHDNIVMLVRVVGLCAIMVGVARIRKVLG
jgi:hypothetical protein